MIGEAVKHLSGEARTAAPEIPWSRIAGMRDKLIHDYMGVNLDLVWDVVDREIEPLVEAVRNLLGDQEPEQG